MTPLPHLAARLLDAPWLIHRPKLDVMLSVLGSRIGLAGLNLPAIPPPADRSVPACQAGIAVIPVYGTLVRRTLGLATESGLTSYRALASQLDAALAEPTVSAILLDIDSPGGEAGGVFDLADRIRAATRHKPVWALANDMAGSAAYALAAGASRIVVTRTGCVGSIGVIAMHADQSARDEQEGVRYTAVFAGERKNDLNPHQPLSETAAAGLQAEVDRVYQLFTETVARHRGLTAEAVRATQAALLSGEEAVRCGLADAVGSLDEALAQLAASLMTAPSAAGGGHLFSLQREFPMSDPHPIPVAATPSAAAPVLTTADAVPLADAVEIAQTCTLAGRSDLIAGFLERRASPAQVRSQLLAAQAAASPEIVSCLVPAPSPANGQTERTPADNPLLQAVRNRLALR